MHILTLEFCCRCVSVTQDRAQGTCYVGENHVSNHHEYNAKHSFRRRAYAHVSVADSRHRLDTEVDSLHISFPFSLCLGGRVEPSVSFISRFVVAEKYPQAGKHVVNKEK